MPLIETYDSLSLGCHDRIVHVAQSSSLRSLKAGASFAFDHTVTLPVRSWMTGSGAEGRLGIE